MVEHRLRGHAHGRRRLARLVPLVRGEVVVDATGASARGTVDLGSLDTGDWARDEHVKGRLFLSYEDFPELTFETTRFDVDERAPSRSKDR